MYALKIYYTRHAIHRLCPLLFVATLHPFHPLPAAARPLAQVFAVRFTSALRPKPRKSTYTSTTLRIVRTASPALSPATAPYRCDTAAATAAPPASIRRTVDADNDARISVAESAARVRVRKGGGVGDGPREPAGDVPCRGGASGGAGEGPRLRGGSGGLPEDGDAEDGGGVGTADGPSPLSAPTASWMRRSAAAAALWLSFTAPPLTA